MKEGLKFCDIHNIVFKNLATLSDPFSVKMPRKITLFLTCLIKKIKIKKFLKFDTEIFGILIIE